MILTVYLQLLISRSGGIIVEAALDVRAQQSQLIFDTGILMIHDPLSLENMGRRASTSWLPKLTEVVIASDEETGDIYEQLQRT
jgi:hypothetical protein